MIILCLIYLLLSLTTATPISRDESPSSPLHKRDNIGCFGSQGHHINPSDCRDALGQMRQHLAFSGPVSGPMEPIGGPFSRQPSDVRYLVPLMFRTPTCTIAVDTADRTASVRAFWSTKVVAAEAILNRCVAPQAIGGENHTPDGFIIMVVNEQNLNPAMRGVWSACLRQGLRVDITSCSGGSLRRISTGR